MTSVGVGARRGVSAEEILAAVDDVLPAHSPDVHLVTIHTRVTEPGIVEAAARRGWPLVGYPSSQLARVVVPTPSERVRHHAGTVSVAEAAALLDGGTLLVGKTVYGRVTVAVAT